MEYQHSLTNRIVLVGLMGCGKSSIGKRLAKYYHCPFVDLDSVIEKAEGCTISEIFANKGEAYFREVEIKQLQHVLLMPPQIIATGGGVFMRKDNRDLIKQYGISIWLKADFNVLLERVSRKKHRPLLEAGDKATILKQLMEERYPIYKEADYTVDSKRGPHEQVVQSIISLLETKQVQDG